MAVLIVSPRSLARYVILVAVPICNNLRDDNVTHAVGRFERRQVRTVAMRRAGGQAFGGCQPGRLLIEVADRAQNHDAVQIDASAVMKKSERLQYARIFHGGSHKIALGTSLIADPIVRPLV